MLPSVPLVPSLPSREALTKGGGDGGGGDGDGGGGLGAVALDVALPPSVVLPAVPLVAVRLAPAVAFASCKRGAAEAIHQSGR
jgi:hypothetical protein